MKRTESFTPFAFTPPQVVSYLRNAERDLAIALQSGFTLSSSPAIKITHTAALIANGNLQTRG